MSNTSMAQTAFLNRPGLEGVVGQEYCELVCYA